jgi:hypothetical protein
MSSRVFLIAFSRSPVGFLVGFLMMGSPFCVRRVQSRRELALIEAVSLQSAAWMSERPDCRPNDGTM